MAQIRIKLKRNHKEGKRKKTNLIRSNKEGKRRIQEESEGELRRNEIRRTKNPKRKRLIQRITAPNGGEVEMAASAREAFDAGATIMHVHYRQQEAGKGHLPSWDPDVVDYSKWPGLTAEKLRAGLEGDRRGAAAVVRLGGKAAGIARGSGGDADFKHGAEVRLRCAGRSLGGGGCAALWDDGPGGGDGFGGESGCWGSLR